MVSPGRELARSKIVARFNVHIMNDFVHHSSELIAPLLIYVSLQLHNYIDNIFFAISGLMLMSMNLGYFWSNGLATCLGPITGKKSIPFLVNLVTIVKGS